MKTKYAPAILVIFALCIPQISFGWGHRAHAVIDRTAVDTLPEDGPTFLKKYVDYISDSATIPDTWRDASEPFSKIEEDPNHGWFREQFAFMKPIPRSRYEFVLALYKQYLRIEKADPENARRMNVRWTGTLPYAAAETYGRLVADMRLLRRLRSEGKDTTSLEMNCAFYVMWMGHYIGDGAQPMHDSIHHDGWQGPNPNNYSRDPKLHWHFESDYVDAIALTENDIRPRIGPPGRLTGDVFDLTLAHLDEAGSRVETIYALDKRSAFTDPHDKEAREIVYVCTASGARMLRDLVYRAWLESALQIAPAKPGPTDASNPLYNNETGSAPASLSPEAIKK